MQYRKFGKLDWNVSVLGFGVMRLPVIGEDHSNIDESVAINMLRYAIDHGVNYMDSGYAYHNGNSERLIGKAIKDGYREKVRIATKMPVRMVEKAEDFDRIFNEQIERLGLDKIDFYLLHGLNAENWRHAKELGIIPWLDKKLAEGRFSYTGFSFHDNYEVFKEIVDGYDNWTLTQIQYNFMDVDNQNQATRKGVEYAAGKDLAVVVMEPLRGGRLSQKPPESVAKIWESAETKRGPVEWALLWLWNQPEISVVLSGMSTMEQVVENVDIADRSRPGILNTDETELMNRARDAYRGLSPIPCTGCRYCMPCPNGVEIPRIFQIYNESVMYNAPQMGKFHYMGQVGLKKEETADNCMECGECLEACPQAIDIPDWLKKVHEELKPDE
ncbi:aldo/keto reductase [Chloroflexota bacterium]